MNYMGRIALLSVASVLSGGCAISSTTVTNPKPAIIEYPHVKRSNLLVADFDRSLSIYRDILGLTAGEPRVSKPDSYNFPVFKIPAGTPTRSMTLSEPGEQRVLALTEVKGIALPRPANTPYMSAVVIGIADLESAFKKIKTLGLTVTEPKIDEGVEFTFMEQAFVDFDGHMIVCYQILPN